MDTRWSGPFSDPQWLMIDLGSVATVCGLTLHWEDAYSCEYRVETSIDGNDWTLVFDQRLGDGHTDDLYFRATQARFVKLTGTKRATGWGHSLWEVEVKGPSEQVQVIADTASDSSSDALFDGQTDACWVSRNAGPQAVTLDFQRIKSIGGLRLDWGKVYPIDADVLVSQNGTDWEKTGEIRNGTGRFDVIMHPVESVRFVRLNVMKLSQEKPMEITEIALRGPDEVITPLALYQLAAEKADEGLYPDHLRKRQVYWTLVGIPKDGQESLLDEYGNLEPKAGSSSLMPYIFDGKRLHSAFQAKSIHVSMADNCLPLPKVEWKNAGGIDLTIEAIAIGSQGDSTTLARYRLANNSKQQEKGKFFLAIRPVQVNPSWQYGGLSIIKTLQQKESEGHSCAVVNGRPTYISLTLPMGFGVRPFRQGDVVEDLRVGIVPPDQPAENSDYLSGAWEYPYDLQPGEMQDVVVAAPLYNEKNALASLPGLETPGVSFDAWKSRQQDLWRQLVDRVNIKLPEQEVADMMKAQVAYILINQDGVSIQPGSRNYKRAWIRDGSVTTAALLRMGLTNEVRDYLDWYSKQIQPNGWVPPILENTGEINKGFGWDNEYDSQGEYIFAIMEYYRFTKDRAFLERHFDHIVNAMKYMVTLRDQTLVAGYMSDQPAPERFRGILPASISHEGYSPAMHSYWDDFFALKGWKDGREAAEVLGRDDIATWADEQYKVFRQSMIESINRVIAFKKIKYVPGCAEKGDPDPTSTAIAFFPCQEDDLPPADVMRYTFDRYYKELMSRKEPGWVGGFTPYEVRSITPFVRLGEKKRAKDLLDYMLSCRRPLGWNHLAEVVHSDPRLGSYIGDMPHTWVGSGYINSVRSMLVYEMNGRLNLLAGVPEDWVKGEGIILENLPTHFGSLNMTARMDGHRLVVQIEGVSPPMGTIVYWPMKQKPARVTADGQSVAEYDEQTCRLPDGSRELVAEW